MTDRDSGSALVLAGIGAWVAITGVRLGVGEWREPGPGFVAVIGGLLLTGLSVAWFLVVLMKSHAERARRPFWETGGAARRVGIVLAALAGFTLLLHAAGFAVSCFLLLAFLTVSFEPRRWRFALLLAVIVTGAAVVIFQVWLQVQFPEGSLAGAWMGKLD